MVRATIRRCSRNHACAGSVVSRGRQVMKYGKALISRGSSTTRIRAIGAVICANLRGTVRIKSARAMAKIAGTKNGRLSATRRFAPSRASARSGKFVDPPTFRPPCTRACPGVQFLAFFRSNGISKLRFMTPVRIPTPPPPPFLFVETKRIQNGGATARCSFPLHFRRIRCRALSLSLLRRSLPV